MIIRSISIKNFKSFGNNTQKVTFKTNEGELILLTGDNGAGKCVHKGTTIDIDIDDITLTPEFINYLEKTDTGRKIFLYIQENKPLLYEKVQKFRKNIKK